MMSFWQTIHQAAVQGNGDVIMMSWKQYRDVTTVAIQQNMTCIRLAAEKGHTLAVKSLMTSLKHQPIRRQREMVSTCLKSGLARVDVIKIFIDDPQLIWPPKNEQNFCGSDSAEIYTLIAQAHIHGHTETAKYLLDKYPIYAQKSEELLDLAYMHGNKDLVDFWTENWCFTKVDEKTSWRTLHIMCVKGIVDNFENHTTQRYEGDSLLDVAARAGNVDLMQRIHATLPKNLRHEFVQKAGTIACRAGKVDSLRWLLNNGLKANFSHKDEWKKNLLLISVRNNKPDLVELLLEYRRKRCNGPWKRIKFQKTLNRALIRAAGYPSNQAQVKILLESGAQDENHRALLNACNYGNPTTVNLLLQHHTLQKLGQNDIMMRCLATALRSEFESIATVELLLETGLVDVNKQCEVECPYHYWTPVTVALQYRMQHLPKVCHPETFRLLIKHGAVLWPSKDEFNISRFLMLEHSEVRPLLHTALDLVDYTDVFPFNFQFYSLPDIGPVSWRFLPKMLEKMSGSKRREIVWNDLLMLLMLDDKCEEYCRAIQQCGFKIMDKGFNRIDLNGDSDSLRLPLDYERYMRLEGKTTAPLRQNYQLTKPLTQTPLISLKSLTRVEIRSRIREVNERKSMKEMLITLQQQVGLPMPLVDYLSFGELCRNVEFHKYSLF